MLCNMEQQTLGVCGWKASWIYHDGGPYDWFLYDKNLRHERVNALLLEYNQWDIFLDYDKIIDIYVSKYQRRMILINPLSKN